MKNVFLQAYQQMNESQQDEVGRTSGKLPWQIDQAQQPGLDQQLLQPTGHQQMQQSEGSEKLAAALEAVTSSSWTAMPGASDDQFTLTTPWPSGMGDSKMDIRVTVVPEQVIFEIYMYGKSVFKHVKKESNVADADAVARAVVAVLTDDRD